MRRSPVLARRHVKFLDEDCHGEERQVVTKTDQRVVAGGGGDGSYFVSTETTRSTADYNAGRDRPAARFPNMQAMFTGYKPMHARQQEEMLENTRRVTEEKKAAVEEKSKTASFGRSIDVEAEEFIRRRRRSLEQQRLMSMKAA